MQSILYGDITLVKISLVYDRSDFVSLVISLKENSLRWKLLFRSFFSQFVFVNIYLLTGQTQEENYHGGFYADDEAV